MTAPGARRASRVYLTGFMGSGKSTVGPLLARALGFEFIDLDAVIEEKEGTTIPGIFSVRGEKEFRGIERRELALLGARGNMVVATGGGMLTDAASFDLVRSSGVLVYLRVSPGVLFERLRGVHGRPMISDAAGTPLPEHELRARIETLLSTRERNYLQAHIVVDTAGQSPADTVTSIVAALERLGNAG